MKKLLLGYGLSNKSIAKYFEKNNIDFDVYDDEYANNINVLDYDLIIKSNGINNEHWILEEASKNNIKVISDLYLFYKLYNKSDNCILVTGSNGKTTVVSLLEKCINDGKAIGNNGLPFFDYIESENNIIIEASSYMLEYCKKMHFKYNVITNLYNTHLEHHKTFVNYITSKCNYLKYLSEDDYLIFNYDDFLLRRICNTYNCKKVSISLDNKKADMFIENKYIYYKNSKIFDLNDLKLKGKHNYYNIMSVLGVLLNNDKAKENFISIIKKFETLDYRLQLIKKGKINIYNDSKSTNFYALKVSLESFKNKNILLIVGGKKRKDNYEVLNNSLSNVKKVYCYGENKYDFANYFYNKQIYYYVFNNLEEVICNIELNGIDTILFSPASTSFDLYNNFEDRGKHFNYLIEKYTKKFDF